MTKPTAERFAAFIETQLPRLYRAARRLTGSPADAEDLVQDTCIAAVENPAGLDTSERPDRWLMRILYNRFVDGSRRRKRNPVVFLDESSAQALPFECGDPGPEALAELADRQRAFDRAWRRLEDTQRALLSLRAEGYGLAEIEDITGIGANVLRARLHRARQSLARHLERQGDQVDPLPRLRRIQ
jgi:RNA polymerase sigma-70 factor (ECF subfamily)